jgi:signal transduction histidine kinase
MMLGNELTVVVGVPIPAVSSEYFEFVPISDIDDTLSSVRRSLWLGAVTAAVLGGILGAGVSRTVLRPLRRVADAAATVRAGDLSTHVETTGDKSLDPLLVAFNEMVDELRQRVDRDARFAGDVTHELRGPLATMSVAVSHAQRHIDDPDRIRFALESLSSSVERFNSLVVDLLEMSRLEAGVAELNLEPIDVQSFMDAVVTSAGPQSAFPVTVGPDVPPFVMFDKRRIGQCVTNLIQNADRYGGGATHLTVASTAHRLLIAVDDDGAGVAEHERAYIFERFARGSQSHDVPGGTGLGLALVVQHLRLHNGTVTVGDSPTGGAKFTLDLPLVLP